MLIKKGFRPFLTLIIPVFLIVLSTTDSFGQARDSTDRDSGDVELPYPFQDNSGEGANEQQEVVQNQ